MAYYTRTGDKGRTRIIGGHVYEKNHIRIETYGNIDALNSLLGYTISQLDSRIDADIIDECQTIQQDLFDCGNDLAQINQERPYKLTEDRIQWLEGLIDQYADQLPPLEKFIIPGGSPQAGLLHMCRTGTREAERLTVGLLNSEDSGQNNETTLRYLNRLSDYFFVIARLINYRHGVDDVQYKNSKPVFTDGIRKNKLNKKSEG